VPLNDRTTFLRIARETADGLAAASRGEMDREIADVVDVMEKIARRVRPLGARLLVVLIPDRVELDADLRREAAAEAASDADFDRLHQTLVARLAARGVPTIDLLGALRAAPTEPPLYRRFDTHWSAAGNRFAAELIAAELARETWCRNG
jgi:lysophospholipase L1-like esterase